MYSNISFYVQLDSKDMLLHEEQIAKVQEHVIQQVYGDTVLAEKNTSFQCRGWLAGCNKVITWTLSDSWLDDCCYL
jgi:hypothetical protein